MSDVQEVFQQLTAAGLSEDEIKEELKRKEREFKGFITPQGALFLIAKENGIEIRSPDIDPELYEEAQHEIDYNEFIIPISDLREGLSNIVLLGKINRIFSVKDFMRKDGAPGVVGSFLLSDPSSTTKIVLWDDHTKIMQTEFFKSGEVIRVINGYCKKGLKERLEVHLSKQGKIELRPEDIPKKMRVKLDHIKISNSVKYEHSERPPQERLKIKDLFEMNGFVREISGTIQIEELKEFDTDEGEKSFLLKFVLSDETGSINVLVWGMQAIEILRMIENDMRVKLLNFFIEKSEYSKTKEIQFTKKSILEIM